jgi:hypothetical protein
MLDDDLPSVAALLHALPYLAYRETPSALLFTMGR